ncbi:phytanoyl-CoA dioxygenase [Hymenobacter gummosus]|uniref:Phytanoyl-CoA dioxygenase n=1 Tax=Hymenobacter gummosus TaxID=1776032 RepID=A0A3S0H748_9BACT|nr:phytanoyl-CoA dioxygenase family protein [Hymenobacter gummosus]RTQ47147.1 phytanoyl-CoA dioxygenase [Hymenobacter gummosus]
MLLPADYPRFTLSRAGLTPEQVAFFRQHGFLHFRSFSSPEEVQALLRAVAALEQQWRAAGRRKVSGVPLKYGRDVDGQPLIQRLAFTAQHSPVLGALLQDARLPALFELLGGPGGRIGADEKDGLVAGHYLHAPGSTFSQMGWHTDALRDVFYGRRPGPLLNVGLHLDACPARCGGLRVLPGTHRQSRWQLLTRKLYFLNTRPDPAELPIETEPGDLTVHDGRMWHRVARAQVSGAASRRRVLYVPVLSGPYRPKHAGSPTPLYLRFLDWLR